MEINNQNGLVAAYSFPYSIVKGTAVNLAPANIANNYNPQQYNLSKVGTVSIIPNGIYIGSRNGYMHSTTTFSSISTSLSALVCFSFKYTNISTTNGIFELGYVPQMYAQYAGNQLQIYTYGPALQIANIIMNIPINTINTIIVIISNNIALTYFNGILVATANISSFIQYLPSLYMNYLGDMNTGTPLNGIMKDFRLYNYAITPQQVRSYHNFFASQVILNENFSNYAVGQSRFSTWVNYGQHGYATGTPYTIGEITSNRFMSTGIIQECSYVLPIGTKYLYANAGATSLITLKTNFSATGTWTFYIGKTNSTSGLIIYLSTLSLTWSVGSAKIAVSGTGLTSKNSNGNYYVGVIKVKVMISSTETVSVILNDTDVINPTGTLTISVNKSFGFYSQSASGCFIANLQITQGITV